MLRHLAVSTSVLALCTHSLPAQGTLYGLSGTATEHFGSAVAGVGDADGDCIPDFAVGLPGADVRGLDSGSVILFSGADGSVLFRWNGVRAGDAMGAAVAPAGDLDGDGYADVLAGAPGADFVGPDAGSAFVLSGKDGSVLRFWNGVAAGDAFGSAVGSGQVNRNGYTDVIIGAPGGNYARVYEGYNAVLMAHIAPAAAPGDAVGGAVAGVGDVNGDGFGDVAVAAPGDDSNGVDAGLVLIVSGRDASILYTFQGDDAGDALGTSVRGAGDVDNDGTPDIVVGAPGDDDNGLESGSVRVFSGTGATLYTWNGDFAGDAMGSSVASAGDVDGDGHTDVVGGAPGNDFGGDGAGAARVWAGSNGAILATLRGKADGDAFGSAVGGVGDANGDGFADVVFGAPGDDDGGADAGSATVFARAPFDALNLVQTLAPAAAPGLFGNDNEFVGDVNADGIGDYAIGSVSDFGEEGVIRVFSGADHSILHAFNGGLNNIYFGPDIGAAGDADGDGHADVMTGAQHWNPGTGFPGRATVRSGRTGAILHQWFGDQDNSHMGSALGGLGDVDGDSVPDFFVGSLKQDPGAQPGTGSIRVYSGATEQVIWEVYGSGQGDWFSTGGEEVGDLNGDGICDFVTGAPQPAAPLPTPPGYAVVLSGADGSEIYRFVGLNLGDYFGISVSKAGDVNGDGYTDILVGASRHDPSGKIDAGMARVFSGADGSLLYHHVGEVAGDSFGQFVNDAGDVNGDGFDDYLVGAPGYDPGGVLIAAGRAYLYSGVDGSLMRTFDGTILFAQFGRALSGIGDANQDGYADLNIGAPQDPTAGAQSGAAYVFESSVKSDPGSAALFGKSCPTSYGWLPLLSVSGQPKIGSTYTVHLRPVKPGVHPAAQLWIGNSNTSIGGEATLPFRLESARGCWLYTNRIGQVVFVPDPNGTSILQTIPNNAALIGTHIYHQCNVADPGVNLLNNVFTNAIKIEVGQ